MLAPAIARPDLVHLDPVNPLHGVLDVRLVRLAIHLERIRPLRIGEVHPLFRDQGSNYYVEIIHHKTGLFKSELDRPRRAGDT